MKRDELMKEYPTELQKYEADNVNWSDVEKLNKILKFLMAKRPRNFKCV